MNEEEAAEKPPERSGLPVAPPAHGPAGSPPTPPSWSYRAAGAPLGPASETAPSISEGPPVLTPRQRPQGAPALPGPARSSAPSFGPAGRTRSPIAAVLLSVLTLGVYALIWHGRVNGEMSDFDPRMRVSAGSSTVGVAIAWLLGLLVTLAGAARLILDLFKVTLPFDPHFSTAQAYFLLAGVAMVPYIILVLPFSVIAVVMTLERIRIVEDRVGVTSDTQLQPTHRLWWLVVPIIGGLVLIAGMQRHLNRVWELSQPRPAGLGA
jgi:hypothetical protein